MVSIPDSSLGFGLEGGLGVAVLELLGQDEREDRTEDMAADRGVAGMEDRAGVEGGLGGPEQGLHHDSSLYRSTALSRVMRALVLSTKMPS